MLIATNTFMNKRKFWLRLRSYLHLSKRFETKDEKRKSSHFFIKNYVKKPENINKHRFSPLLHYKIIDNRFRRTYQDNSSIRTEYRSFTQKPRPIFYCNHLDTQIFAYYASKINKLLEIAYKADENLNQSVIGYRAIPLNKFINKSTLNYASEVFNYIKENKELNLVAACLDISSFYDNLNHKILKKSWYNILGRTTLNTDEYKVFKAITQAHFLDLEQLLPLLPSFDQKRQKLLYKSKKGKLITNFTELRTIISKHPNLIKKYEKVNLKKEPSKDTLINKDDRKGIPQGTPISAVFSNLYFLEADKQIAKLLEHKGIYRRYSDDILIICSKSCFDEIYESLKEIIKNLKLELSEAKNQIGYFNRSSVNDDWSLEFYQNGILLNKPISYLGFSFDAKKITIKNSSISKYYRSVKRLIRRSAYYAKQRKYFNLLKNEEKDEWIFKRRIYKTKSYLGAKKRKIGGKVYWGNFISYAKNASKIMKEKSILNQVKNHWKIINDMILRFEKKYNLKKQKTKE